MPTSHGPCALARRAIRSLAGAFMLRFCSQHNPQARRADRHSHWPKGCTGPPGLVLMGHRDRGMNAPADGVSALRAVLRHGLRRGRARSVCDDHEALSTVCRPSGLRSYYSGRFPGVALAYHRLTICHPFAMKRTRRHSNRLIPQGGRKKRRYALRHDQKPDATTARLLPSCIGPGDGTAFWRRCPALWPLPRDYRRSA